MSAPLSWYIYRLNSQPDAFRRKIKDPVLLFKVQGDVDQTDPGDEYELETQTAGGVVVPAQFAREPLILSVRKRRDEEFREGISLGRRRSMDVVLDANSISRFHAWFSCDFETGLWFVTDSGSKNGTEVNGRLIQPHQPVALGIQSEVRFGDISTLFLMPDAFFHWILENVDPVLLSTQAQESASSDGPGRAPFVHRSGA